MDGILSEQLSKKWFKTGKNFSEQDSKSKNRNRVLVIGLDGATFDLLLPWIKDGKLPVLSRLIENGVYANLRSTIPMFTPTAWSSFMTGKNPGKHGITGFFTRKKNSYDLSISTLPHGLKTIWTILSEVGKKVIVINVPMTYPPEKVNGFIISGMMTPSDLNFTYPPSLKKILEREVGKYEIYPRVVYERGKENEFLSELIRIAEIRMKTAIYLFKQIDWDFSMVVFNGTDQIQHAFWNYIDPHSSQYDKKNSIKYMNIIFRYYRKIDEIIGHLLCNVGNNTTVIIMSDHGFGPLYGFIHVNIWLKNLGFLKFKNRPMTLLKRVLYKVGMTPERLYSLLKKIHMSKIRRNLGRQRVYKFLKKIFLSFSDVDWTKTKAFSLGAMGQIFINLRGREPNGIVCPGDEYKQIVNKIIKNLEKLTDPRTNSNVIDEVYKKHEIYKGSFLEKMPDIIFVPKRRYISFEEYEFASNSVITQPNGILGTHRLNGIFIISGPNIRKRMMLDNLKIEDLAPTILYLFGVSIPLDMDGIVHKEIFTEDFLKNNPLRYIINDKCSM